jgi:hypothetical protein
MEGQFFFTTIAGLGISIAGFAGLMIALRPDRNWTAIDRWRVRNIIYLGFRAAFLALIPIPIFALSGDVTLTIRIASAIVLVAIIVQGWNWAHEDPEEWPEGRWANVVFLVLGGGGPNVANLWLASLGLFEVVLLILLVHPANIFTVVVQEVVRQRRGSRSDQLGA